jgi:hypothetical protein
VISEVPPPPPVPTISNQVEGANLFSTEEGGGGSQLIHTFNNQNIMNEFRATIAAATHPTYLEDTNEMIACGGGMGGTEGGGIKDMIKNEISRLQQIYERLSTQEKASFNRHSNEGYLNFVSDDIQ